jgi:hypothetical protein
MVVGPRARKLISFALLTVFVGSFGSWYFFPFVGPFLGVAEAGTGSRLYGPTVLLRIDALNKRLGDSKGGAFGGENIFLNGKMVRCPSDRRRSTPPHKIARGVLGLNIHCHFK